MQRDATEPILLDEDLVDSRPLIDDPEPQRKPFGERFAEWRKHYLPLPDEVVEEYLGEDEYVVHTDHPSFRAFLVQNIMLVLIIGVVGPIFAYLALGGITWTTLLLFFGLDVVLLYMALKRLQDRYVSYVISNLRLIRVAGVFGRRINSIPWTRMTGLGYFQTPVGRILGYATVFIESANEESGLRSLTNINDPATFHQRILDLVSSKTGQSAGGKPPPPTKGVRKSLLQRRRERREVGGPNKAAAPWPTSDDPDGSSSDTPATDTAQAYEASVPDEDKKPSSGSKQTLRPQPAGRRAGPGGGGAARRGQAPPSARRRGPAPPGPTDPYGDPVAPVRRGSGASPGRRPGTPGSAGRPSVADTTPRGQQLPRSGGRSPGEGRPSLIPEYGRNRPGATPADETSPPAEADADADETSSTEIPQPRRESAPLTPPRGTARIRPGEPRTPPGDTDSAPSRGPAPTPPPPRPPQRGFTGRRSTPPAGTPAVRPGEPRGPFPPTDAAAETTDLADETIDLRSTPGPTVDREPRPDREPPAPVDPPAAEPPAPTDDRLTDPGTWPDPTTDADSPPDPGPGPTTGRRRTEPGPSPRPRRDPDRPDPEHGRPDADPAPRLRPDTDAESGPAARPRPRPRAGGPGPATGPATGSTTETGPATHGQPAEGADAQATADEGVRRRPDAAPEQGTTARRRPDAGGPDPVSRSTTETGPETETHGRPARSAGGHPETEQGPSTRSTADEGARPRPETDAGAERDTTAETGPEAHDGSAASAAAGATTEQGARRRPDADGESGSDAGVGDAPVAEVPEFAPPPPRTPPSSRRMTPPGGTSAVRPGEPRTPPSAGEAGADASSDAARPPRTEPVIPPSLRRQTPPGGTSAVRPDEQPPPRRRQTPPGGTSAVRPGEQRPPRRPGPETGPPAGSGEDAGATGDDSDEPRRQPWLFGRQRPETGEPAGRRRRRFSWFRREPLVEEDEGADGDAHDALETLRPLGSARRRAQSFRRPRFRSFGRGRRSLFPPNRELPAATDDDPDASDDRPG